MALSLVRSFQDNAVEIPYSKKYCLDGKYLNVSILIESQQVKTDYVVIKPPVFTHCKTTAILQGQSAFVKGFSFIFRSLSTLNASQSGAMQLITTVYALKVRIRFSLTRYPGP